MSRLVAVLDENRLEGIIVKRKDSTYREGKEPGTWIKHLLYRVGEFIFRGYLKRDDPYFDALIVGEKSGSELHYKQKVRFGFDDEKKRSLMKRMDRLAGIRVPFRESSGETAQRLAERTADARRCLGQTHIGLHC